MKVLVFISLMCVLLSCSNTKRPSDQTLKTITGGALGTTYNILYFTKQQPIKKSELDSIFNVVNQSMSTYIPSSDISKINKGDSTVVIDKMFEEVFLLSKKIHSNTGGYFDPTVGKLVNAWGFGPKKLKLKMNQNTVDSLKQFVGFSKLKLNPNRTINKQNKNIELDFNAIAKGYCIDRLASFFNQKKIDNYLIELGGELIAKGTKINTNRPWTVGVDNPNQTNTRELITTLSLTNKAMATSGNYRKFRIDSLTGKKYVHTINPITGFTIPSAVLSASVIANDCATADAYATAFMAMPLSKTIEIVNKNSNLEAYILFSASKDSIGQFASEGFKKLLN